MICHAYWIFLVSFISFLFGSVQYTKLRLMNVILYHIVSLHIFELEVHVIVEFVIDYHLFFFRCMHLRQT